MRYTSVQESLQEATTMVKAGNVGCNEGCTGWIDYYNSSKGTRCAKDIFAQYNKGKVINGVKPGPKQYLSVEEETELAEFAIEAASVGCGERIKASCERIGLLKDGMKNL